MRFYSFLLSFFIFSTLSASSQTLFKGKITDASTHLGIPGVSVLLKGTEVGAFTDDRGRFSFHASAGTPAVLLVSSIGYQQREISVSNAGNIEIELETAPSLGQEVVVSASKDVHTLT